ncbi:stabilizer of axonemal microtubules 4 [Menidia menidia]
MAEQGRIVMPTVGATGRREQLSRNKLKPSLDKMGFTSYIGHPSGTGFTSNQRPAIYYKPSLDLVDNPKFGGLLSDSFMSQTKRHYQPHVCFNYLGSLPNLMNTSTDSGFHQLRSFLNTVPVEEKTEYQQLYVPHPLTAPGLENHVKMGPKGVSGFTEETERQLNTFLNKNSPTVVPRKTQSSVMKNDFVRPCHLQGTEAIAGLRIRSCRETGFTRGAIAPLACPSTILPSPQTKGTAPTVKTIGKKEPTGALLNTPINEAFPNGYFDSSHFTTHYRTKFCRRSDLQQLSSSHSAGIISSKMSNGYNRRDTDRFIFRA